MDDRFAENELKDPRPGLNGRVVSSQLAESSLAFSRPKTAADNSADGLNVVVLAGRWDPKLCSEHDIDETRLTLATAFSEAHSGYRFKRILIELMDAQDRLWASAVPLFRIRSNWPDEHRALAVIEKPDLQGYDGSVLARHFSCPLPCLFLRASDQELLLAALDNPTDESLTKQLGLTKEAIKRRWKVLFERVENEMPEMFEAIQNVDRKGRGPQRRHVILAYIRKHPEELRPFARVMTAQIP